MTKYFTVYLVFNLLNLLFKIPCTPFMQLQHKCENQIYLHFEYLNLNCAFHLIYESKLNVEHILIVSMTS